MFLPDINSKICVIGLGYVGLPLVIEFGKTREVIAFDINQSRIKSLKDGFDSTLEVSQADLNDAQNIRFTSDESELKGCGIFIITVPTPIDSVHRPELTPLKKASETVGKLICPGALVIYESTVYPGCTEEVCVPILESMSGLDYQKDFFCGYSPERINPGDKVNTLTKIKKITSGSCSESAAVVDKLYSSIITAGTFLAKSIRVAEAAKVIENTQRDLNIALVNELSVIFERLDIDTADVLDAAGTKWNFLKFNPGLVGGHCIGVDPYYLTHKAEMVGYNPQVILAGRRINDNMARYVARNIIKRMVKNGISLKGSRVGVLGVTFKENCPDVRNSKIVDLVFELESWGIEVILYDPWASAEDVEAQFKIKLSKFSDLVDLDSMIVTVGHDEFRKISLSDFKSMCRGEMPVFGDVKSIFSRDDLAYNGFTTFRL
ncbi:nucleotide sugar dehydrogenase [Gammaproteobacteria bacterium]|nr:nucleotide sugar dehydrogenase [Gammaproteobacteria bacterium]